MKSFTSFKDFWPYYLAEHSKKQTRTLHFLGSGLALMCLLLGVLVNIKWLFFVPIAGYGFAWVAHFKVEHNKPATFIHPWWSLIADYKMFYLMCVGRIDDELQKYNIDHRI